MAGKIYVGIGGWTFEPWRDGVFYPAGLSRARELAYAASTLTSIEINGTYYSSFKPATWRGWHDQTPDGFVFAIKGSRYVTNRKVLAQAGPSIERFVNQGLTELGSKLGPINWQFMATKKFDPQDFAAFLGLLPQKLESIPLRHVLEVRHPSFDCAQFKALAHAHGVGIVYAAHSDFPLIEQAEGGGLTYARIMGTREEEPHGLDARAIGSLARKARGWAARGDVFVYFIAGAKMRNPAAACALIAKLQATPREKKRP